MMKCFNLFGFVVMLALLAPVSLFAQTCPSNLRKTTPTSDFTLDDANGVATHRKIGLIWSRCALGQTWNANSKTCDGEASEYSWQQALQEVAARNRANYLGFNDWRLPNIQELRSIVEHGCIDPAINATVFPATPSAGFWSASVNANDTGLAWFLYFGNGYDFWGAKDNARRVRVVRAGQFFDSFNLPSWSAPTPSNNTTPDAFQFEAKTNVALASEVLSNAITVSGINAPAAISVQNGEYQINNGSWTNSNGTVKNGDRVKVRHTSSGLASATVTTTLTIGGVSAEFRSTTQAAPANKSPVASFTATPESGKAPLKVALDAAASRDEDGQIKQYTWQTSDGQTAHGPTASFTFSRAGNFSITLTVTDDQNATGTASRSITVSAAGSILGYNETARVSPQIIMAGVSPSVIDMGDTGFDVLALVRPGILPLQNVTVGQGSNALFSLAMQHINTLPNGDQLWKMPFAFARGDFPAGNLTIAWGSGAGQFYVKAIDQQQQIAADDLFPTLTFANTPAQSAFFDLQRNDNVGYLATKRLQPQVIMAGVSPSVIDILDTEFDILALIRPGLLPIQNVLLKQGGNPLFSIAMQPVHTLKNGDEIWKATFAFQQGAFPPGKFPVVWGSNPGEFLIQVIDNAQQVSAVYPTLRFGNFPAQK